MTREEIILAAVPKARMMASQFHRRRAPLVERDDRFGDAILAIVKHVGKYDPAYGLTLPDYVALIVKRALRSTQRKADVMPRHLRRIAGHTQSVVTPLDWEPVSREISPEVAAMVAELTPRRMRVVELVALGKSNAEIAAELGCGLQVVKNTLRLIYAIVRVKNRTELAVRYTKHHPEIKEQFDEHRKQLQLARNRKRTETRIARLEEQLKALRGTT